MEIEQIKKELKNKLSEKRFYHSICVMNECEKLAKLYDENIEDAKKIGLSHDIAKEMPIEEKFKYIKDNSIIIDDIEKNNAGLLHAKIGADICEKKFNFNKQLKNAIEAHTTGIPKMDMLAKILYIADGIGIDRNWEDIGYVRKLAQNDINQAILYMLNMSINENIEKNLTIHPNSILLRNEILLSNKKIGGNQ